MKSVWNRKPISELEKDAHGAAEGGLWQTLGAPSLVALGIGAIIGAATVAIAWSEYLNKLLEIFGVQIPYAYCHSPFQTNAVTHAHGIINLPALGILAVLTLLLIRGIHESAMVNIAIVIVKVVIVILIIALGWSHIDPANHTPYIPPASDYVDKEGVHHAFGGAMGIRARAGRVLP